jgi:hypothetical protein
MGSPLSPVIANFFMDDFEDRALKQVTHKLLCWFRYVDDTFVIWPHGSEKLEVPSPSEWPSREYSIYHGDEQG